MPPRVTVIIPTYNWSSVLPYSIGSVLGQTFRDFELLVVGDGCTDDSEQVVTAIGDPRVRWINLPQNTRHQSGPNNEAARSSPTSGTTISGCRTISKLTCARSTRAAPGSRTRFASS